MRVDCRHNYAASNEMEKIDPDARQIADPYNSLLHSSGHRHDPRPAP